MKAAVLYDINTSLQIERIALPNIENDQVRVRLVASGVWVWWCWTKRDTRCDDCRC